MKPEQIRELLRRRPFQPFRVRLKDGQFHDIRYPNLHLVGESVFMIGIPAPDDPDPQFYDTMVWVMLKLIDGIERLPEPAPSLVHLVWVDMAAPAL